MHSHARKNPPIQTCQYGAKIETMLIGPINDKNTAKITIRTKNMKEFRAALIKSELIIT
jgi:hypothetical protein